MTAASVIRRLGSSRRGRAWAVPVVVAGAVLGGTVLSTAGSSGATPTLAPRSTAQLLAAVGRLSTTALSGRVSMTANLGLPDLPGAQSSASLSWQTFVSGTHHARVWVDGRDKQRVALTGELSEADVVHNGNDVWTYTSDSNAVSHWVLARGADAKTRAPNAADYTPAGVAARVLQAINPSTSVRVDESRTVADRAAYTLVIRPRDSRSTIRKITIAVDAHKFVPLQVQVFGAGSKPAFQIGFTKVSFATPRAAIFNFRRPAGSSVSTDPFGMRADGHGRRDRSGIGAAPQPASRAPGAPKVIGTGWTSVLELSQGLGAVQATGMLAELTSPVANSDQRLLHTALVNAVIMPDGRVFVGAVNAALLEHIAATTPR